MMLLGFSKMLFSMGQSNMKGVAAAMLTSLLAFFYTLAGLLFAAIPMDDHQLRQGGSIPQFNKLVYLFVPLITLAIYFLSFLIIIMPVATK